MWVEKHRPKKLSDMVGNEGAREQFLRWLNNWRLGRRPALLLGPPGVGKTTMVHAAGAELGYQLIELNASDVRTKVTLQRKLGPSLTSQTIFGEKLLFFLDEIDGIYGRQDYGGVEFVLELIRATRHPLVMAANTEDDQRVRKLSNKCQLFILGRVPDSSVETFARRVLASEQVELDPALLQEAVARGRGDIRAAINNIQAVAELGIEGAKEVLTLRDQEVSLREALETLFSTDSGQTAHSALTHCGAQPREKIRAIHSSLIASKLDETSLLRAFTALSKADEVLGRIGSTQEWRQLRYFDRLLAYSIFTAVPRNTVKFAEDDLPWNLKLRVWNESRTLRDLALKISPLLHVSRKNFVTFYLPYLTVLLRGKQSEIERLFFAAGLEESAIKFAQRETSRVEMMLKD